MSPSARDEITALGAGELLERYRERTLSPVETLDAITARIEELDPDLGAFNTLCLERARAEAAQAEAAYARGEAAGSLAGVPFAAKDLYDTAGVRTTYGSPIFASHVPAEDAQAISRVRRAGGILIGKTQTHEFAWGITSVNQLLRTSRNPWARERISGGSSGGSAVALAARLVPLALGTDTGGSIRIPSSFCGIVGLKPSYGRVSATGVFRLARSLDHAGPMARTPGDAARLFAALTSPSRSEAPVDPATHGTRGLQRTRVGLCADLHAIPLAPDVEAAFNAAARATADAGAELVEVDLPEAAGAYETFVRVQRCEALRTHTEAGLYPDRRAEYGEDVVARLDLAAEATLEEYLAGIEARERLRAGFHRLFDRVDLLLTPTSAGSPAQIGNERVMHLGEEIEFRELVMSYTVPQNLTGLPACAVRAGFDSLGVPIGVQLTGPAWSEWRVLAAAQALWEATAEVQARWPNLAAIASA